MPRPKKSKPAPAVPAPAVPLVKGALSVKETCAYLSVSRNTLYRLEAAGDLRPIRVLAKPIYRLVDITAFLARCAADAEIPA